MFVQDANKKEITIRDLAKKLNVSTSTISRALRDEPSISKQTKQKILNLAEEVGYRYNYLAGNLRQQKTTTIGVIANNLNNHFITSALVGIEKVVSDAKYDLLIGHSCETGEKEIVHVRNFFRKRVDGLIISLTGRTSNLSHLNPFIERRIPVVFIESANGNSKGIKVIIDNYKAGFDATTHLINQGCKRVMIITGSLKRRIFADRLKGYKDALQQRNFAVLQECVIETDLSEKAIILAVDKILKMKFLPDGIFVNSDAAAALLMKSLNKAGIKIPDDMVIVGFNNDPISTLVKPQLSTINYDATEMGKVAAETLLNQLGNTSDNNYSYTVVLPSELIIRGSTLR
jgi:LacI family transcriptional regulator